MDRRYAEPYQPTSFSELKTVVILGMATVRMVLSRAMSKVPKHSEAMITASLQPDGYRSSGSQGSMVALGLVSG